MKDEFKTFDFSGINTPTITTLEAYLPLIESVFTIITNQDSLEIKGFSSIKKILTFYDFNKVKITELKDRLNPKYTLSIARNRKSNDTIVARVKWSHKFRGEVKKDRFISVFIASTTKFPKGLKDPNLKSFAKDKIYNYLYKNAPIELMNSSGEVYTL